MTVRVEFTQVARAQILAAAEWWRANRLAAPELFDADLAAPELFDADLAAALEHLENTPRRALAAHGQ